jgi:hypothetical protein
MRQGCRASLGVVLLLLVSVGTASAECAWVLWLKADFDAGLDGEWTVMQALAARQNCIAALQEMFTQTIEKFKASNPTEAEAMERRVARGSLVVVGRGQSMTAKCLPDTIDPRGAKEGSR